MSSSTLHSGIILIDNIHTHTLKHIIQPDQDYRTGIQWGEGTIYTMSAPHLLSVCKQCHGLFSSQSCRRQASYCSVEKLYPLKLGIWKSNIGC